MPHELARRRAILAEAAGAYEQLRTEGLDSIPARVRSGRAMAAVQAAGVEAEELAAAIGVDPALVRYLVGADPRPAGVPIVVGGPRGFGPTPRPERE